MAPNTLSARQAAQAVREGTVSALELTRACLARIDERESQIHAFAYLNRDLALAQAEAVDRAMRAGHLVGPLAGVPVGVKDVFDTFDQPTQHGSPFFKDNQPREDSTAVALLRRAGAVILGKTVTTELANPTPPLTRNPHDITRTPGSSSSGSAAAVADFMVHGAIGTQSKASVIRPSSYCGIFGFKPSHGLIPRTGVLRMSRLMDQVGSMARTLADAALLAEVMLGYDPRDPDSRLTAPPQLAAAAVEMPLTPPRFLVVHGSPWAMIQPGVEPVFDAFIEKLHADGIVADVKELPADIEGAMTWIDTVMDADTAYNYGHLYRKDKTLLGAANRDAIERGQKVAAEAYLAAADEAPRVAERVAMFLRGYDAILTLAATGEAEDCPELTTGKPVFCSIWNFAGLPALTLPLLHGPQGMPVGIQLIGPKLGDCALLRTANWLEHFTIDKVERLGGE